MKIVNFIGRNFHRESGSADFFIQILSKYYFVNKIYPDEGDEYTFDSKIFKKSSIIFVWQSEHISYVLSSLGFKVVNVSMFDGVENRKDGFFNKLINCININFSKSLHDRFSKLGLNSIYLKYYPNKIYADIPKVPNSIFFWERDPSQLSCEDVFAKVGLRYSYHLHGISIARKKIIFEKYRNHDITFTTRINDKNNFLNFLSKYEFYVAPRLTEGIGMSFLDGMNVGCIPIGYMRPTFSEYVKHNLNGFDINFFNPDTISLNLDSFREKNSTDFLLGSEKFKDEISKLMSNIESNFDNVLKSVQIDMELVDFLSKNFHKPDYCMELMDQ